ncbi:hypothetical protein LTR84_011658 [Exophiala bonariae]|uniref:Uncharacterized protein n=1 Tax=Exophiala bonariae TaxID=1690606 RepID=A0AAV9NH32_9EURO|nr:hypothetical protein LTR84_011658 [Exophiala bonariae]
MGRRGKTGNQKIAANPKVTLASRPWGASGPSPPALVAKVQAIHAACFEKLITAIADRMTPPLAPSETFPVKAGRWARDAEGRQMLSASVRLKSDGDNRLKLVACTTPPKLMATAI